MSTFRSTFPSRHTFLAVVHVTSQEQALRNVLIARNQGADGAFLINHDSGAETLINYYLTIRDCLPDFWIGLNCLDLGRLAIKLIPHNTSGLWVDNAGISETSAAGAEQFARLRPESHWEGIYFGGVAFKYQAPVADVAKAARLAVPYVDVITTSGPATGKAADISKISAMKAAIGDHPLAIASGITPENVENYLPYCDCFLVATGISNPHAELNPTRVQQLAQVLGK